MIDKKYRKLLTIFFMSLIMSFVMTTIFTISSLGFDLSAAKAVFINWPSKFLIAFPTGLVFSNLIEKIVLRLTT